MRIPIYKHTLDDEVWYTDNPDPNERNARKFGEWGGGIWMEVRDKRFISSPSYAYIPTEGVLVTEGGTE